MQSRAQSGKTAKLYDFSHFDNDDAEDPGYDDDDPGDDDDHYHNHHHCRCQSATAAPLQPLSHFVHRWIALAHPHALEPFYDSPLLMMRMMISPILTPRALLRFYPAIALTMKTMISWHLRLLFTIDRQQQHSTGYQHLLLCFYHYNKHRQREIR